MNMVYKNGTAHTLMTAGTGGTNVGSSNSIHIDTKHHLLLTAKGERCFSKTPEIMGSDKS